MYIIAHNCCYYLVKNNNGRLWLSLEYNTYCKICLIVRNTS